MIAIFALTALTIIAVGVALWLYSWVRRLQGRSWAPLPQ